MPPRPQVSEPAGSVSIRTQIQRSALPSWRTRLDNHGLRLLDLEVIRLQPDRPADDHRPLLEIAAELGATWVLTVLQIPDRSEQVDRLGRLGEIAAELGVLVSLEFMAFTTVRTLADALALSAVVPGCRVLVDALHLARTGGSPADVAPHAAALSYAQLCDGAATAPGDGSPAALAEEARHARLLPGDGVFDLAGLIAAVPDRPAPVGRGAVGRDERGPVPADERVPPALPRRTVVG